MEHSHCFPWYIPTNTAQDSLFSTPLSLIISYLFDDNLSNKYMVISNCSFDLHFPGDSVQFSRSVVSDFATPWITACQASLSITNSRSSLKLMSIESVMPSSHLILCRPLFLLPPIPPSIRAFSNESTLRMGGQSTGVSALASFLPKNLSIQ